MKTYLKNLYKAIINKPTVIVKTVTLTETTIELGLSHDLIGELEQLFPRRMFVHGMTLEHFAENAGQYQVILHLRKLLNKARKSNQDVTRKL